MSLDLSTTNCLLFAGLVLYGLVIGWAWALCAAVQPDFEEEE